MKYIKLYESHNDLPYEVCEGDDLTEWLEHHEHEAITERELNIFRKYFDIYFLKDIRVDRNTIIKDCDIYLPLDAKTIDDSTESLRFSKFKDSWWICTKQSKSRISANRREALGIGNIYRFLLVDDIDGVERIIKDLF